MITIEASNIYFGGSYNLLLDFLDYCDKRGMQIKVYSSFKDVFKDLVEHNYVNVAIEKSNLFNTVKRYFKHRDKVFFFCSLPPFVKCRNSYTYFHCEYYSTSPFKGLSGLSSREVIKKWLYFVWLSLFKNKCDGFLCQTKKIADNLKITYNINAIIAPFYKLPQVDILEKKQYDFIYPAFNTKHKNHLRLFSAVSELRKERDFSLIVTIPENDITLIERINTINSLYPNTIINLGIVNQQTVFDFTAKTKALLFPSTSESLGLPLIESLACGTTIISADLDYTYNAITNPITFDPFSEDAIKVVMKEFLDGFYIGVQQSVKIKDTKEYIYNILT